TAGPLPVMEAGSAQPGPGQAAPAGKFVLILDPGAHVFTVSRRGFADVVLNRTFRPGSQGDLDLKLDLLPATLKASSAQRGALVRVDEHDVGPVPVSVLRPPGKYTVEVAKDGFVPYRTKVTVKPGDEVVIPAQLSEDKPSILTRWWFWGGVAVLVGAGVAITYAATRPDPQPP